jgi:simple sugar transport system permease protein
MTSWRTKLLPPLLAIVFAVLLSAIALIISGADPLEAYGTMIGQMFKGSTAVDTVNLATVYYLSGLAVAIGFQMNLFNIGVEGQYQLAAVLAASAGAQVHLPPPLHVGLILVVAMSVGAGWAGIAGVLKAYRGVHEVISTIMLNAIVTSGLLAYLLNNYLRDHNEKSILKTKPIPSSGLLPSLNHALSKIGIDIPRGADLQSFVLFAVLAGILYYVVIERTRFGFDLRATGVNPFAARTSGVEPKAMILKTMLVSGAIAGLVGMPQVLGFFGRYHQDFPTGLGFAGIAVALLGRNRPFGMAIAALLFGFLQVSSQILDFNDIPKEIVEIMQAAILFSVVISYELVRRRTAASETKAATEASGGEATGDVSLPVGVE